MPQGWDLGARGAQGGQNFIFSNMVVWLIKFEGNN